jgi:hypothetical protein
MSPGPASRAAPVRASAASGETQATMDDSVSASVRAAFGPCGLSHPRSRLVAGRPATKPVPQICDR